MTPESIMATGDWNWLAEIPPGSRLYIADGVVVEIWKAEFVGKMPVRTDVQTISTADGVNWIWDSYSDLK